MKKREEIAFVVKSRGGVGTSRNSLVRAGVYLFGAAPSAPQEENLGSMCQSHCTRFNLAFTIAFILKFGVFYASNSEFEIHFKS